MRPVASIIQYTTLAATTARDIAADSGQVPFLGAVASLTLSIVKSVELLKSNKRECLQMVENIHEILCALIKLYSKSQMDGILPPRCYMISRNLQGISSASLIFSGDLEHISTLQKIYAFVEAQQGMGKIKRLLKQADTSMQLELCKAELKASVDTFRTQSGLFVLSTISEMTQNEEQRHKELLELLEENPDWMSSERYSVSSSSAFIMKPRLRLLKVNGTPSIIQNSSESLSMLPGYPSIFHGREKELQEVVDSLQGDAARVAILGPGGMGKTSLAAAVLHHSDVTNKYPNRYFPGPNLAKKIYRQFTYAPPSLLVLDNFETPWESTTSRGEVEDFLALITDIPHLAILITMRGAERPGK
ncbi:hypothetical protein K438DRAFT_1966123 [Mycena galopus ATCC 62051]|nr:hypothetical protein K438DRAFT_1966123 [Mycena galopus ATCC 62051]